MLPLAGGAHTARRRVGHTLHGTQQESSSYVLYGDCCRLLLVAAVVQVGHALAVRL